MEAGTKGLISCQRHFRLILTTEYSIELIQISLHVPVGPTQLLRVIASRSTGDDPLPDSVITSLIARFMGSTWDPPEADRTQVGPMVAPWTLLSGLLYWCIEPINPTAPLLPWKCIAVFVLVFVFYKCWYDRDVCYTMFDGKHQSYLNLESWIMCVNQYQMV